MFLRRARTLGAPSMDRTPACEPGFTKAAVRAVQECTPSSAEPILGQAMPKHMADQGTNNGLFNVLPSPPAPATPHPP